jgi:hypothetical protein
VVPAIAFYDAARYQVQHSEFPDTPQIWRWCCKVRAKPVHEKIGWDCTHSVLVTSHGDNLMNIYHFISLGSWFSFRWRGRWRRCWRRKVAGGLQAPPSKKLDATSRIASESPGFVIGDGHTDCNWTCWFPALAIVLAIAITLTAWTYISCHFPSTLNVIFSSRLVPNSISVSGEGNKCCSCISYFCLFQVSLLPPWADLHLLVICTF